MTDADRPWTGPETLADRPDDRWRTSARRDVYSAWILDVHEDAVIGPDGSESTRVVLDHPGAVVVLAVDDDRRVALVRQYRHAVGQRLVELPAGVRDDPAEDPEQVGRRELREEVELAAAEWTPLLSTWSSPGYTAERIDYFLARGLTPTSRGGFELAHEEADMEAGWAAYDELLAAVLDGRVADGPVAQAVLAARVRGLL